MNLALPESIASVAEEMARTSGAPAERLLLDSLAAHFPPITAELQAEFDAWEFASDEDMARFDAAEGFSAS
jgi:hypothetical protein